MKFKDRYSEIIIGDRLFTEEEFELDIKCPFDRDPEPQIAELKIYNTNPELRDFIEKNTPVIVNAGYEPNVGSIFMGKIDKLKLKYEDIDIALELKIGDSTKEWKELKIEKTYNEDIQASTIINDLLGKLGLEVGTVNLKKDKIYKNGKTITGNITKNLKNIINKDCDTKFYIKNGTVIIRPEEEGKETAIVLNKETGLIESPTRKEGDDLIDFDVFCFLNHNITVDTVIIIESNTANGTFRVVRGEHVINNSDFITRLEVASV